MSQSLSGTLRSLLFREALAVGAACLPTLFGGCDSATVECSPKCENRQCGGDGCGGICGTCLGTQTCALERGVCLNPACGDGDLDQGETCDPPASCPVSCEDKDPCTRNEMSGSAGACNVVCSFPRIDQCGAGDGCCPAGCDQGSDPDCHAATSGIKSAGWRSSEYGHQYDKPTSYWVDTAKAIAGKFPGSKPAGVYVIGELDGNPGSTSSTYLSFPKPAGNYPNITFDTEDKNASYLDAFDGAGVMVWLQVEPADASVDQLIDLVLNQYGSHPCVKGFGVDVEWLNQKANPDGRQVTNAEVNSWIARVKTHDPDYKLFLKHWDYSYMPPSARPADVVYITDSEEIGSFKSAISEYTDWANHFSGSQVGYQIGYPSDQSWWSTYADPIKTIGDEIVSRNPTADIEGLYWVDFSITDLFP